MSPGLLCLVVQQQAQPCWRFESPTSCPEQCWSHIWDVDGVFATFSLTPSPGFVAVVQQIIV